MIVQNIFFRPRFYWILGTLVLLMLLSFLLPFLLNPVLLASLLFFLWILREVIVLAGHSKKVTAKRKVSDKLSLGDTQNVHYHIKNQSKKGLTIELYDELPHQFQYRKPMRTTAVEAESTIVFDHALKPIERGEYLFGDLIAYIGFKNSLVYYKKVIPAQKLSRVFPSVIQLKKYALGIFSITASMAGIRKVRSIGDSDEFEHIRPYHQGDSIKSINWKATSRSTELVVNQYEDSKSQSVYFVIDKGRSMEMPFQGLSLQDHSINAALVLSNTALNKYDKVGLITFSKQVDSFLPANDQRHQLERILNILYNQETEFSESGYEELYHSIRKKVSSRSIFFLFTNFETMSDLERNLEYLKLLSRRHLLVVVLFKNMEVDQLSREEGEKIEQIFMQNIAFSLYFEKRKIVNKLKTYGIQAILTAPEHLTVNAINKYLEIKSKRMR